MSEMLKIGVSGTFLKPNVDWSERMDKIRQRMLEDSKAAFQGGAVNEVGMVP